MPSGRCPYCKRHTIFNTVAQVQPLADHAIKQGLKRGLLTFDRCGHADCQAVVYRELQPSNSEIQWDMYPPLDLEVEEELPEKVKRSYKEALDTFANGIWNAAAQAVGRALTDAMMELKPSDTKPENWAEHGLKKQIDILVQQKILPPVIGEWAQEVRAVRVLSEHGDAGKDWWATQQEATEALEFTKWVFRYVFVLPAQIRIRRERLKQPASQ